MPSHHHFNHFDYCDWRHASADGLSAYISGTKNTMGCILGRPRLKSRRLVFITKYHFRHGVPVNLFSLYISQQAGRLERTAPSGPSGAYTQTPSHPAFGS